MLSFVLGIASIATLLGFMVGASSSPVSGVALTAAFGIVAAALTYLQGHAVAAKDIAAEKSTQSEKDGAVSVATLNALGQVLIIFSFAFSIGLGVGIWARVRTVSTSPVADFPWGKLPAPKSARAALDWMLVHRNLKAMGYDNVQIEALYKISQGGEGEKTNRYGSEELLSPLFGIQKVDQSSIPILTNLPPPQPTLFNRPFDSTSPSEVAPKAMNG